MFVPPEPPMVAGIPAVLRTAYGLVSRHAVSRVFLSGASSSFVSLWRGRVPAMPWQLVAYDNGSPSVRDQLDAAAPVVVLAADGIPDVPSLCRFLDECRDSTRVRTWTLDGAVLAAYYPEAGDLPKRLTDGSPEISEQAATGPDLRGSAAPREAWQGLSDSDGIRRAEGRFLESLRKDTDGYLARLDRSASIALSRRLARTPVTPNNLTVLNLVLGVLGAALLISTGYWTALLGAALLWSGCVLDGCDGEVARFKLLASPAGARFDEMADNLVHLATFVAIVVHVHRLHPEFNMRAPGLVMVAGVLLSMVVVWQLILRRPEGGRARLERILERLASRDYVYLVVLLTALQQLEWLVWAAAAGAHLFWFIVWWASGRARPA